MTASGRVKVDKQAGGQAGRQVGRLTKRNEYWLCDTTGCIRTLARQISSELEVKYRCAIARRYLVERDTFSRFFFISTEEFLLEEIYLACGETILRVLILFSFASTNKI